MMEDFIIEPNLAMAVNRLVPGSHFWIGETADSLEWKCDLPEPSVEEIEAKHAEMLAQHEKSEYRRLRAPEYPSVEELADAIYWNEKGDSTKLASYISKCEEVKAKYPKPEEN